MAPLSQSVPPPGAGGALRGSPHPAAVVVLAGVCAALHVGKLAPALAALQQQLGLDLVLSGFLLSTVQLAGLLLGLAVGLSAGSLGLRRCLLGGLAVLTLASLVGGLARQVGLLLALRALEGLGFLLVVMPAPALIRQLETTRRLPARLGWWGSYMPLGTALALLVGPFVVAGPGWPAWWWLLAGVTALMAVAVWHWVPAPGRVDPGAAPAPQAAPWRDRLRRTLGDPGPWLVALCFAVYSAQWLAVIGFLPLLYTAAGLPVAWGGVLMATAALSNGFGNVAAGRLLQRGWPPARLLRLGFAGMAWGAWLAYAGWMAAGAGAPWRLAGLPMFSA
ncbi:MAG: MFS transporter, partial [Rhodoferax sp.]|nr:MFS transporter [Rhodoferax sp.]